MDGDIEALECIDALSLIGCALGGQAAGVDVVLQASGYALLTRDRVAFDASAIGNLQIEEIALRAERDDPASLIDALNEAPGVSVSRRSRATQASKVAAAAPTPPDEEGKALPEKSASSAVPTGAHEAAATRLAVPLARYKTRGLSWAEAAMAAGMKPKG